MIDDVRVYNYALSPGEIGTLAFSYAEKIYTVKNTSDETVAWFDEEGNLFLTGTLTQTTPSASGNDEFRIQDSSSDVAIINMSTGDMVIAGSVNDNQGDLSAASHFIVKDDSDSTVAYVDTSGNVYLAGRVYENANP